ncbi:hypothetical protein BH20BAC1_BH20BAC1_10600 [soil metagenome]
MQLAGLLALRLLYLPIGFWPNSGVRKVTFFIKDVYSYGDSAGFTPASLLIFARFLTGERTVCTANVLWNQPNYKKIKLRADQ